MSDSPISPNKKEINHNIIVALIGAGATLCAATVPIVTNLLKPNGSPNPSMSAALESSELGQDNFADGKAHYITLLPYDTSGGDSHTAIEDAYFRSPKDSKAKWIRLTITQRNHNQVVTLSGTDFESQTKTADISANDAKEGDRYEVKTKRFTIHANVRVAETGADPDKSAPIAGSVFRKLELRIDGDDHS